MNGESVSILVACLIQRKKSPRYRRCKWNTTIFDNKKLTPEAKKTFRDIFLYNCEIWTITSSQAGNTINAFQQILLRIYVLNMK